MSEGSSVFISSWLLTESDCRMSLAVKGITVVMEEVGNGNRGGGKPDPIMADDGTEAMGVTEDTDVTAAADEEELTSKLGSLHTVGDVGGATKVITNVESCSQWHKFFKLVTQRAIKRSLRGFFQLVFLSTSAPKRPPPHSLSAFLCLDFLPSWL